MLLIKILECPQKVSQSGRRKHVTEMIRSDQGKMLHTSRCKRVALVLRTENLQPEWHQGLSCTTRGPGWG